MSYNGWTNWETWNMHLWMSNDEGSYRYWCDKARECANHFTFEMHGNARELASIMRKEMVESTTTKPNLSGHILTCRKQKTPIPCAMH